MKKQDRSAAKTDRVHPMIQRPAVQLQDRVIGSAADGGDPAQPMQRSSSGLGPDRLCARYRRIQHLLQMPPTPPVHASLHQRAAGLRARGPLRSRCQASFCLLGSQRCVGHGKARDHRVRRAAVVAAYALDIDPLREMVLLVHGVLAEAALRPTGRTALPRHQHVPSGLDRREAIGIPAYVEYYYRVCEGDRALVGVTGRPGFPFPSYQLPASSIR